MTVTVDYHMRGAGYKANEEADPKKTHTSYTELPDSIYYSTAIAPGPHPSLPVGSANAEALGLRGHLIESSLQHPHSVEHSAHVLATVISSISRVQPKLGGLIP